MLSFIDRIPMIYMVFIAIILGLAPFLPEPHLWQKLKMLVAGTLTKPIDIFDLLWHSWPIVIILIKLYRAKGG